MVALIVPYLVEYVLHQCVSKPGRSTFIPTEANRKLLREWFGKHLGVPADNINMFSNCIEGWAIVCIWKRDAEGKNVTNTTRLIEVSFKERVDCILLETGLPTST
jgi:hypothetical protein